MATTHPPSTSAPGTGRESSEANWPRWVSIVLGAWLFLSAWLWYHTPASGTNTVFVGLVMAGIGTAALWTPSIRWVNTAAALWLFVSTFVIEHGSTATIWNNAIVGVVVFVASLIPSGEMRDAGRPARVTPAV